MTYVNVVLNGKDTTIDSRTTIHQVVVDTAGTENGVAVAVDGNLLRKPRWDITLEQLSPRTIDILSAVQGG